MNEISKRLPLDRYVAAGLTHNPFAATQRPAAADIDVAAVFVDRGLPDPPPPGSQTLVQVIGASGFGKSTQLRRWQASTPGPYHYIPRSPYSQRWTAPPGLNRTSTRRTPICTRVYGDEIDRMPVPLRWRWFRALASQRVTLLIGTHVDLTSIGRRAGFAVVTHHLGPIDEPTMRMLIDRQLSAAALDGHTGPTIHASDLDIDLVMAESGGIPGEANVICHRILAQHVL